LSIQDEVPASKPQRVMVEGTEVLAEGHIKLERIQLRTETFSGEMSKSATRDISRSGPSVAILLYDPERHAFVLTEQFRLGAYLNHVENPWLLECVAGMVDEGETPEAAARREVQEETGCQATRLEVIGRYLTSPGLSDELITVYVAAVDATRAGGVHGKASEGENIRTRVLSVGDALERADRGDMLNIVTQVAMLWFAGHGEELRKRWRNDAEAGG